MGTLGIESDDMAQSTGLTTPDCLRLHQALSDMADAGIDCVAIEASSHGLSQYRLDGVRMNLRPVQEPHPPVWIAANNEKAIRRAARLGDAWFVNPHSTLETIRRHVAVYRDELAKHGRPAPAELPTIKEICCAKDRATALEMAGPYLLGKYRDYAKWGQDKVMPQSESFDKDLDELTEGRFILGSPEECFEQLRPYWEELGINHFCFRTHWAGMPVESSLASMRLISRELVPELCKI